MIRRILPLLALALLADTSPAPAQVPFGPAGFSAFFAYGYRGHHHYAFGGGYRYAAPVYGYGVPYSIYLVPPPIVVVVIPPPPVIFKDREPTTPVREPLPTIEDYAPARVDAAVKRGDFLVVKPGQKVVPAAAAIPLPQPPVEPKALAAFLVQQARAAFEVEQAGRAGERLRAAIALQPKDAKLRFWLAQVHVARGEYAEAGAAIRDGMALEPDWPASPFDLKELHGPRAEALAGDTAELRGALAANPGDAGLQFVTACCEWFSGNRQAALKLFEKAKREYPIECQRFLDVAKR